jgi:dehydrogenase/reductase SDR family protein 4
MLTFRIGLATAERFGHEGAKVLISSRIQKNVDEGVKYLIDSGLKPENVAGLACHVGDPKHRKALVELALKKFGRIDILLNNAGKE